MTVVLSKNIIHDFVFSCWASPLDEPGSVNSTKLAVYNFKSSKLNELASPFKQKRRKRLNYIQKLFLEAPTQPAQWFDLLSVPVLAKILFDGQDKLVGGNSTKGSDHCTPALGAICAPIPAVASVVAPLVAFGFANSFIIRYSEDDLQRIVKTIPEARPLSPSASVPVPAPVVAAAPHYKGLRERLLKA